MEKFEFRLEKFEGPLDFLLSLIDKNKMSIHDISVHEITKQYLEVIEQINDLEMDYAAEFIYMAASLIYIKSRELLPKAEADETDDFDANTELVLKLLAYRRCKYIAEQLKKLHKKYAFCLFREATKITELNIRPQLKKFPDIKKDSFQKVCEFLQMRISARYNDLTKKMTQILQKDRRPLYLSLQEAWLYIKEKKKIYFTELIKDMSDKNEKISSFLAILELLRMGQISVEQEQEFANLKIQKTEKKDDENLLQFIEVLKASEI